MNTQTQPATLKIVVEESNDDLRVFHTNFELTELPEFFISRHEQPSEVEWSALAFEVVQLPGVERITLRPYWLSVQKGTAFEWEAISPAIKQLLLWVGKTFVVQSAGQPTNEQRTAKSSG